MPAFVLKAVVKPAFAEASFGDPAAVGAALDDSVDAALAQEDIDESEGAEEAVEAIRTSVEAAIAGQAGDVVLSFNTSTVTDMNALKRGLEAILRVVEGGNLFGVQDEEA